MPDAFQYDVFLSHNRADKPRVRQLAERLRAAGLRVWFDEWVIHPGDDIYLAIERGLEAARVQVLCLSQAALGSDWVSLERSTVLFRDPTNAERRFVPLLLAECQLPDTLRRYKYIDLRDDTAVAFQQLLSACQPRKKTTGRRKQAADTSSSTSPAIKAASDLAGYWTATARPETGKPYAIHLSLKTFGQQLLGSVSYPSGTGAISGGKVEGDTFSFQTQHLPNFSEREATIHWFGKITGEELKGVIQNSSGATEFTATRTTEPRRYGWQGGAGEAA
jgi:hypothetical protein